MLSRLEQGVAANTKKYIGPVNVTWENLVERLALYALDRARTSEASEEANNDGFNTCMIIFRLIRDHLVKARSYPLNESGDRLLTADGKSVKQNAHIYITVFVLFFSLSILSYFLSFFFFFFFFLKKRFKKKPHFFFF
jgi:hypothetical protein